MKYSNINYCWGSLIVEELLRCGVDYFCIAPGSRSAPLTVSIARHKRARTLVHFDERGLAFHALGYATATGMPAVIVCTSGTAVANLMPAVVEASKKKVQLIVLSADRPPELRQTGAVQTIDQPGIFGKYVVWQTDMPCPDLNIKPEFVLTTIDQAVYQARRRSAVVHINCMFREPLDPTTVKIAWGNYFDGIKTWDKTHHPYTQYVAGQASFVVSEARAVAKRINAIKDGIVVVGKLKNDQERQGVVAFAKRLGWPIFADVSSGLRLGDKAEGVIHYFDQLLLSLSIQKKLTVGGVVHFGGRMTSKRYYDLISAQAPSEYIMVLNHSLRSDPLHKVTLRLEANIANFCSAVTPLLKGRSKSKMWAVLSKADTQFDQGIDQLFKRDTRLGESKIARLVSQCIEKGNGLFLANSMPIRDMDMFGDFKGAAVQISGNRGASGIDGLISSASGYAEGLSEPVVLMIGDLAILHDLNSLAILRDTKQPLVIVALNNGGGGIFSFLPIAEHKDVFERFFGTPHAYTFANAAAMFELNYSQPHDMKQFSNAFKLALKSKTSTIIEVIVKREKVRPCV